MSKIEEIVETRRQAHQRLLDLDSKAYKAFLELEEAAFSAGHLPVKIAREQRWKKWSTLSASPWRSEADGRRCRRASRWKRWTTFSREVLSSKFCVLS